MNVEGCCFVVLVVMMIDTAKTRNEDEVGRRANWRVEWHKVAGRRSDIEPRLYCSPSRAHSLCIHRLYR
jgi:hypothetical protein